MRILGVMRDEGLRAAYHAHREQKARGDRDWERVHRHLAARLRAVADADSNLRRLLDMTRCREIADLEYEAVHAQPEDIAVEIAKLPHSAVIALYSYFRYFGDFRVANFFRLQVLNLVWRKQPYGIHPSQALAAGLELGEPEAVLRLIESGKIPTARSSAVAEIEALANALLGRLPAAQEVSRDRFDEKDRRFLEGIRGRSVAVVGPAPAAESVRGEIDSFDVVVRTNWTAESTRAAATGSRTDISYYNGNAVQSRLSQVAAAARDLHWAIFKVPDNERAFLSAKPSGAVQSRCGFLATPVLFDAIAMAIPNVLHDLFRFGPARVKIFYVNFHNAAKPYDPAYVTNAATVHGASRVLRTHEPFSGFVYVQNLYKAGLCEADTVTASALAMDRHQYASAINQLYGAHTVLDARDDGPAPRASRQLSAST